MLPLPQRRSVRALGAKHEDLGLQIPLRSLTEWLTDWAGWAGKGDMTGHGY